MVQALRSVPKIRGIELRFDSSEGGAWKGQKNDYRKGENLLTSTRMSIRFMPNSNRGLIWEIKVARQGALIENHSFYFDSEGNLVGIKGGYFNVPVEEQSYIERGKLEREIRALMANQNMKDWHNGHPPLPEPRG